MDPFFKFGISRLKLQRWTNTSSKPIHKTIPDFIVKSVCRHLHIYFNYFYRQMLTIKRGWQAIALTVRSVVTVRRSFTYCPCASAFKVGEEPRSTQARRHRRVGISLMEDQTYSFTLNCHCGNKDYSTQNRGIMYWIFALQFLLINQNMNPVASSEKPAIYPSFAFTESSNFTPTFQGMDEITSKN